MTSFQWLGSICHCFPLGAEDVRMGNPVFRKLAENPPRRTEDAEGHLLLAGLRRPQLYAGTLPGECECITMTSKKLHGVLNHQQLDYLFFRPMTNIVSI